MADLQEKMDWIESQGISKTPPFIRGKILRNLDVPVDSPAEVAVITGCNALLNPLRLVGFANLLRKLKVNFTYLSFEHCCFAEIVRGLIYKEDASVPTYEEQARIWNRRNCTRSRDLGAHTVINLCAGCNTSYLRHTTDLVRPVYYVNYLLEQTFAAHLDLQVDLYEGCHRKHNYYPECQAREENSIALLEKIEGLTFNRLPASICCNKSPEQVLKRVTAEALVAPSSCCNRRLKESNTDPRLQIYDIIDIVNKALV